MSLKTLLIILFLFVLTFVPRLYKISNPVADWHSWRQSDTAAVARSLYTEEFNLLFPRAHNYLPMNGLPNPNRYFLNEFPFYNALVALIYQITGVNEMFARLVSVFFASTGTVFLYLLVKNLTDSKTALVSSMVYAALPFNIYYGRVIMPDPTYIALSIISLYFIYQWTSKDLILFAILAGLTSALAMLVKPYAIVLALPAAYLVFKKFRFNSFKKPSVYLYLILSLVPILLWRWHINQYPEGMFGSGWLVNQGNIRFTGAFFRWLIFERMNRLIFATGGFVLFFFGLVSPKFKKEGWFFILWLISVGIYMTYFARGNVTHDYYQLPLVPVGSILVAKGVLYLIKLGNTLFEKTIYTGIAVGLVLLMLAFGWYEVRGFFNINHPEIIEAGHAVDLLTPKNAIVIAPYSKDPAFLYQTNRNGWTDYGPIEHWIQNHQADYLVSVNFDEITTTYMSKCRIAAQGHQWVLIDLSICNKEEFYPDKPPMDQDVAM